MTNKKMNGKIMITQEPPGVPSQNPISGKRKERGNV